MIDLSTLSEQQAFTSTTVNRTAEAATSVHSTAIANGGPTPTRGGLAPRTMRRVREHIETNLAETITIKALAAVAGLSMFHFARAFRQSAGLTPHSYVIECRVRRVKELLAETDLLLSEVALAAGFSDQSHCARRFREHVGVSPREYRWLQR